MAEQQIYLATENSDGSGKPSLTQNSELRTQNFETLAVHAGERAGTMPAMPTTTPIYATSTFLSDAEGLDGILGGATPGYVYARYANPTVAALETAITALEGGAATAAFGSGMAALHAALLLGEPQPGDVILAARDLYGASHTMLHTLFAPHGIEPRFVDCNDLDAYRAALAETPRPRAVLVEPISNPLIRVLDMAAIIEAAHAVGARVIVDNTFPTPYLFRPLDWGADLVLHSATKYFSGHGDVVGGSLTVRDPDLEAPLRSLTRLLGAVLSPFDAHLIHRGLKTLALRLERHSANALAVAEWLAAHPAIEAVHYPGLPAHSGYALAQRQFRPGVAGGMLAFAVRGADQAAMFRLIDRLRLLLPATTLGDVYSEVSYPLMSSHRGWSPALLRRAGITANLLRVSIGIEAVGDIIADLDQALVNA